MNDKMLVVSLEEMKKILNVKDYEEVLEQLTSDSSSVILRYKDIRCSDLYLNYNEEYKCYFMALDNNDIILQLNAKDIDNFIDRLVEDGWKVIAFDYDLMYDMLNASELLSKVRPFSLV